MGDYNRKKSRDFYNTPEGKKYKKEWEEKNKDRRALIYSRYREKNAEKLKLKQKEWSAKNTHKKCEYERKRRAKKVYSIENSDITTEFLKNLWEDTEYCVLCGKKMENNCSYPNGKHLDHIYPLCCGGLHITSNVRYICSKCNLSRPKIIKSNNN